MTGDLSALGRARDKDEVGQKQTAEAREAREAWEQLLEVGQEGRLPPGQLTGRATYGQPADPALRATSDSQNGGQGPKQGLTPGYITGRAQYGVPADPALRSTAPDGAQQGGYKTNPRDGRGQGGGRGYGTDVGPGGQVVPPAVGPLDGGPVVNPPAGPRPAPIVVPPRNPGGGEVQPPAAPGGGGRLDDGQGDGRGGDGNGAQRGGGGQQGGDGGQQQDSPRGSVPDTTSIIDPPTPEKQRALKNSEYTHLGPDYWISAAAGGVFGSGPLPYLADRMAAGHDGKLARLWRSTASPTGAEIRKLEIDSAQYVRDLNNAKGGMREALDRAKPIGEAMRTARRAGILDNMIDRAQDDLRLNVNDPALKRLYENKLTLLENAREDWMTVNRATLQNRTIKDGDAPGGGRFLLKEEADFLGQQRELYGERFAAIKDAKKFRDSRNGAKAQIQTVDEQISALAKGEGSAFNFWGTKPGPWQNRAAEGAYWPERAVTNWRGNKWSNKIGEGLTIAGVALAGDMIGDSIKNSQWGHSWKENPYYLEGPILAAMLLAPQTKLDKFIGGTIGRATIAGVAMLGLPALEGRVLPQSSDRWRQIMRPNDFEAFATAAAWAMPWEKPQYRAGAVGLAWLGGRGLNLISGTNPDAVADLKSEVRQTVSADSGKFTDESYQAIVGMNTKLGLENDLSAKDVMNQFLIDHKFDGDPAFRLHAGSALAASVADVLIARGTRTSNDQHNADSRRLLPGYDLCGDGARFYQMAQADLRELRKFAEVNKWDKDAIAEIDKTIAATNEKLDKTIYAPHDIGKAVDDIKAYLAKPPVDMAKFEDAYYKRVSNLPLDDPKFVAKMMRDSVLLDLAYASHHAEHNNGYDAEKLYQRAVGLINVMATERMGDDHPDFKALVKVAKEVNDQIPEAQKRQRNSRINSPNGQRP